MRMLGAMQPISLKDLESHMDVEQVRHKDLQADPVRA